MLIGPLTLLLLGKEFVGFHPMTLLPKLTAAYKQILETLAAEGIEWVQMDEPMLVTDLESSIKDAYRQAYSEMKSVPVKLMLTTYFDSVGDNLETAIELDMAGLHIDVVRAPRQLNTTLRVLKTKQVLSVGVEGRNIWLTDWHALSRPEVYQIVLNSY
jgi:5-methyltetrahydropteroyltriglutamate--homocysteine methyltransferase